MAETSAGERYGLNTNLMFPRLYPYLSERLEAEYREQTNVLDSSAVFALLFGTLALLSGPLVGRFDGWSMLPLLPATLAIISYRGACQAARNIARQQATAFDLHRFDMLAAMHQPLPSTAQQEQEANMDLCKAIEAGNGKALVLNYRHPGSVNARAKRRRA